MPHFSMKLIASAVGSLALVSAVACEQRTETPRPDPATMPTPAQEPNALRPTPSTATPGTGGPGSSASAPIDTIDNSDTQPVRGTDPVMQAGGAGGAGGHGGSSGHGGSAGHGGKTMR